MSWMEQAPSSAEVRAAIGPPSSEAVFLVLRRMRAGRVPAIVIAVIGMLVWFVTWVVFPFWGLVMMILYGLIIYALTAFSEYFE